MEYHFSQKFFIGYSDVDRNNRIKLSKLVDLLQNTATGHSKTVGYGTEEMMKRKQGWLVLAWKIKVIKYPVADMYVEVRTWSKKPKGLHAYRDFEIVDESGNVMVLAMSSWVLYDLESKRPTRTSAEMLEKYGEIDRNSLEEGFTKIVIDDEGTLSNEQAEIVVGKRDIDTNGHTNNAKYLDFMMEVFPDDLKIEEIELEYKKQVMYAEKLLVTFDGKFCTIKNENDEIVTIARLEIK